jgi:hypothetical protein
MEATTMEVILILPSEEEEVAQRVLHYYMMTYTINVHTKAAQGLHSINRIVRKLA